MPQRITPYTATEPAVASVLQGQYVCVMAYGQTGAGKTFSMSGGGGAERGIVRLAADEIVSQARLLSTERARHGQRLTVRMLRRLEHTRDERRPALSHFSHPVPLLSPRSSLSTDSSRSFDARDSQREDHRPPRQEPR